MEFKYNARYSKAYICPRYFIIATENNFLKRVSDICSPYGKSNEG
jgi:hypothetical protein